MHENLKAAVDAFDADEAAFPHDIAIGGYSDDCHILRVNGRRPLSDESEQPAVRVTLPAGGVFIVTAEFEDGDWIARIALPEGARIECRAIGIDEEGEEEG